jgi:AcrR family transcriptional regulator
MGLIDRNRRKKAETQKRAQRGKILEEAKKVFAKTPYDLVSLGTIARRAKAPEGMPELLFGGRSGLFFEVLRVETLEWLSELEAAVGDGRDARGALIDTLAARPAFTRMWWRAQNALDIQESTGDGSRYLQQLARAVGESTRRMAGGDDAEAERLQVLVRRGLVVAAGIELFARPVQGLEPYVAPFSVRFAEEMERLMPAE